MTDAAATAPVVAGVDGSAAGLAAVRMAAREAALRRRPLRLVHAFVWPMLRVSVEPPSTGPPGSGLRNQAERIMAEAVAEAMTVAPDRAVIHEIVDGAPAPVLLRESRRAALLVLGYHGLGPLSGAIIGSVASQVATHAECPVLVARSAENPAGPVVVGVDGSPYAEAAIDMALEEAALRGSELVVLHARRHPAPEVATAGKGSRDGDALALPTTVARFRERYPQVRVTYRIAQGRPTRVFVRESGDAQLLVVGARGREGFPGLRLGSVSQAVLHHGNCPLLIVRNGHQNGEHDAS
ncbi:MAG TPA: universal stress protein [Micromonospora sp.]